MHRRLVGIASFSGLSLSNHLIVTSSTPPSSEAVSAPTKPSKGSTTGPTTPTKPLPPRRRSGSAILSPRRLALTSESVVPDRATLPSCQFLPRLKCLQACYVRCPLDSRASSPSLVYASPLRFPSAAEGLGRAAKPRCRGMGPPFVPRIADAGRRPPVSLSYVDASTLSRMYMFSCTSACMLFHHPLRLRSLAYMFTSTMGWHRSRKGFLCH